ncbi:hypothetical protein B8W69_02495 [Mycobacterium vulneris]|uniref:Uncharacterized protein n=1 Tax=Mycolicibacterium vulneris TaxID=547163 RepID=A0A1X2LDF8_9MYCO|nr:hypothetical protein B8W69_02495 [Mycolicibacterium vulneris]
MAWRVRNLRALAATTDTIANGKTIECAGPTRKALHYAAFRKSDHDVRMHRTRFVTRSINGALQ